MATWLRIGCVTELAVPAPGVQSWLSGGELARLASMPSARRSAQFVAGRRLARSLLADAFGGRWQDWTLSAGADEAPAVSGPTPASVSISHSGDHVACAVGTAPLGLDLEACRARKGLDALHEAITTAAERSAIASHLPASADAVQRFTHAWTLKEAGIKYHGGGLFASMLGHGLSLEAAADANSANACTWLLNGQVLALCGADMHALAAPALPAPRYWRLVRAAATMNA
ncbi:4'-phosphopantetheinyl transferase family protein [Cupriavidus oxalaticus]|jgi:4'-phosphopantetheinyl transferase|uniref:4'-phosphopantetheinyl transferase superfamily protein n=1 Tax=Cupriavidus oxalaticus TaxID=96344 RepID=A0A976GCY2_9BURK|nr:4'-phosphopantetheinyl transferase superfamily protein [Cupriavidus oxalaticus]QRQ84584.1 4'-phosphopantetheinyl transferase superfamily protein [Cupriavidus oxalaticus]QRQ91327.1 4'-phosphopantetheinyl transferase superfamily protein [Cupriavidus oxalaticus]WQD85886.1 4'-phosphopantetheinyl transferase superfamily protein [Cupriavidus oxalaticus]SPC19897.1 conserved hypothetical protein [Cupriavidus oxalaticus]